MMKRSISERRSSADEGDTSARAVARERRTDSMSPTHAQRQSPGETDESTANVSEIETMDGMSTEIESKIRHPDITGIGTDPEVRPRTSAPTRMAVRRWKSGPNHRDDPAGERSSTSTLTSTWTLMTKTKRTRMLVEWLITPWVLHRLCRLARTAAAGLAVVTDPLATAIATAARIGVVGTP